MVKHQQILNKNDKRQRNASRKQCNINKRAEAKQEKRIGRTNTLSHGWPKPLGMPLNVPHAEVPLVTPVRKRPRNEQRAYHNKYYHEVRKRKGESLAPETAGDDQIPFHHDAAPNKRRKCNNKGAPDLAYKGEVRRQQRAHMHRSNR